MFLFNKTMYMIKKGISITKNSELELAKFLKRLIFTLKLFNKIEAIKRSKLYDKSNILW